MLHGRHSIILCVIGIHALFILAVIIHYNIVELRWK